MYFSSILFQFTIRDWNSRIGIVGISDYKTEWHLSVILYIGQILRKVKKDTKEALFLAFYNYFFIKRTYPPSNIKGIPSP